VKLGKRRAWIAGLGVLMLLALVMRACWPVAEQVLPVPGPEVTRSASQPVSRPLVASAALVDAAVQRPEARWCALSEKAGPDLTGLAEREIRELNQLMADETERLERHLKQSLRADPSTRAQAVAEWLADASSAKSSARLQDLARASRDPFVIQLALQRGCEPNTDCRPVEPELWAEVEPGSLAAALLLANSSKGEAPVQRWSRLPQTSYDNKFPFELLRLLEQHLPTATAAGLQRSAQDALLLNYGVKVAAANTPMSGLTAACRGTELGAERTRICEGVAEKLWTSSSATELGNVMALVLVRALPDRSAHWLQRAQQAEAMRQWRQEQLGDEMVQMLASYQRCGPSSEVSPLRRRVFAESEWAFTRAQMLQAGVDEQALAQRWRAASGRSLLDAPQAASAVPKR